MTATEDEKTGLDPGAMGYIVKPVNSAITLARVRNHLQLKLARDLLHNHNQHLGREGRCTTTARSASRTASCSSRAFDRAGVRES